MSIFRRLSPRRRTAEPHAEAAQQHAEAGDWEAARDSIQAALDIDPRPDTWWGLLGQAHYELKKWRPSNQAYRQALERNAKNPQWHAGRGRALVRFDRLRAAEAAYSTALRLQPKQPDWLLARARIRRNLGKELRAARDFAAGARAETGPTALYEAAVLFFRTDRLNRSHKAFARAQSWDPDKRAIDRALFDTDGIEFGPRRAMAWFIEDHLDEIRAAAGSASTAGEIPARLFVYWAQGWDQAPPIVQRCRDRLTRTQTHTEVVELDDTSVRDWIDLPATLPTGLVTNRTEMSNLIRLELLDRHGGVWADATCWFETDATLAIRPHADSGFFAFTRRPTRPSNWLLASSPGHEIVRMWLAAHHVYWQHRDRVSHYYMSHHIFGALYLLDDGFRAAWDRCPQLSADPPHALQAAMYEPYDAARLTELREASFVQKLTYKYQPAAATERTILKALLQS